MTNNLTGQFTNHQTSGDDCLESGEGESMRDKFEAWWEENQHNGNPPRFGWAHYRDGETYTDDEFQTLWEVWKGSRSSIEIHLPGEFRESYQSSNMVMYAEAVKERLAEAGITVKE